MKGFTKKDLLKNKELLNLSLKRKKLYLQIFNNLSVVMIYLFQIDVK